MRLPYPGERCRCISFDRAAGRDRLVGGAGKDIFGFDYGTGRDRIIDFVQGEDRLVLPSTVLVTFDQILTATSRDDLNGLVTIDLSQLFGAAGDRVELLTDPAYDFVFTKADFFGFV